MKGQLQNGSLVIHYNRNQEVRSHLFELEKFLGASFQTPFQLNAVDDNAPPEIPRIAARSRDAGHLLNICQINYNLVFNLTAGTEWPALQTEINNLIGLLFHALNGTGIDAVLYSGLSLQIFFPFENAQSVLVHMKEKFMSNSVSPIPNDLNLKFTFIEKEKYYVNYHFVNKIEYAPAPNIPRMVPAYMQPKAFGLLLGIDINDRFAFNFNREYLSEREDCYNLSAIADNIISHHLDDIINGKITLHQ